MSRSDSERRAKSGVYRDLEESEGGGMTAEKTGLAADFGPIASCSRFGTASYGGGSVLTNGSIANLPVKRRGVLTFAKPPPDRFRRRHLIRRKRHARTVIPPTDPTTAAIIVVVDRFACKVDVVEEDGVEGKVKVETDIETETDAGDEAEAGIEEVADNIRDEEMDDDEDVDDDVDDDDVDPVGPRVDVFARIELLLEVGLTDGD